MDEMVKKDHNRLDYISKEYACGKKNTGGAAYDIINLDYNNSPEGAYLKNKDTDAKVRALMRSKNIDSRSNTGFNMVNGQERYSIEVPIHKVYNPDGSANYMNSKN